MDGVVCIGVLDTEEIFCGLDFCRGDALSAWSLRPSVPCEFGFQRHGLLRYRAQAADGRELFFR